MKRLGIIGDPVAHSLSPIFQNAALEAAGIDAHYEAWHTPRADLPARVGSLRDGDVLGANVTIPHKGAVIPLLDGLDPRAALVGAVNTVVQRDGKLTGYNTDGAGFVEALRREAGFEPAGKRVLLLGAGGAARGITFALGQAEASAVHIWNRTPARAERLAEDVHAAGMPAEAVPEASPAGYACIVNCTSVGMEGTGTESESPINLAQAEPGTLAVDIVYRPADTAFLHAAQEAGLPSLGGLPMLIYQGALAFELWTGAPAPVDVMFRAAREALARPAPP
ncbi:MAG: shikimate dehydrogenase [Dehalococcoidia bacterium]|nr:shikimate dehydrogenase [Dehalococcoidia bacterium]